MPLSLLLSLLVGQVVPPQPIPPATEGPPRLVLTPEGPLGQTLDLVFSPDGQRLLAGGRGKVVDVWDLGWNRPQLGPGVDAATPVATYRWEIARSFRGNIARLAHSSDGLLAIGGVSARDDALVTLVDTATGQVVRSLPTNTVALAQAGTRFPRSEIIALAFSPSGRRLASRHRFGETWVWTRSGDDLTADWRGQELVGPVEERPELQAALAFLSETQLLVGRTSKSLPATAANRGAVKLATEADGRWRTSDTGVVFEVGVTAIDVASPRRWAVAGNGDGAGGVLVDGNRKIVLPQPVGRSTTDIAVLPDGRVLMLTVPVLSDIDRVDGGRTDVVLYSSEGEELDRTVISPGSLSFALAVSPDGRRAVVSRDDDLSLPVFELLDAEGQPLAKPLSGGPRIAIRSRARPLRSVEFVDAQTLRLRALDGSARTFSLVDFLPRNIDAAAAAPPAYRVVASGDFDDPALPGNRLQRLVVEGPRGRSGTIELDLEIEKQGRFLGALAVAERGDRAVVIVGTLDGAILVFDYGTPGTPAALLRHYRDHTGEIRSLAVSPDSSRLASLGLDGTVKLWPLASVFATPPPETTPGAAWGMTLDAANRITALDPAGIARARGLEVGDQLLEVRTARGGEEIKPRRGAALRSLLTTAGSNLMETHLVDVLRGGQRRPADRAIVPGWEPLLTLFLSRGDEFALFTPSPGSYYTASAMAGPDLFGWQLNRGSNHTPRFVPAADLQKDFERPDVIREVLRRGNVPDAVAAFVPPPKALPPAIQQLPQLVITSPRTGEGFAAGQPVTLTAELIGGDAALLRGMEIAATLGGSAIEKTADRVFGGVREVQFATRAKYDLNRFIVVAREGANVRTNRTVRAEVSVRTRRPPSGESNDPKRYAVHLFGLASSQYAGGWDVLEGATDDVDALLSTIEGCIDVDRGPVVSVNSYVLKNDEVTPSKIAEEIRTLRSQLGRSDAEGTEDLVVVFLVGHGKSVDKRFYYIPTSLTKTSDSAIEAGGIGVEQLADLNESDGSVFWLIDTCEAGGLANPEANKSLFRTAATPKRVVLTASTGEVESFRNFALHRDKVHGQFTTAILDAIDNLGYDGQSREYELTSRAGALRTDGAEIVEGPGLIVPGRDPDGTITLPELVSSVIDRTKRIGVATDEPQDPDSNYVPTEPNSGASPFIRLRTVTNRETIDVDL